MQSRGAREVRSVTKKWKRGKCPCAMLRRENRIVNGKIILRDTYNKQEIWDNRQARCLFNFPINDPSKQEKRLPDYQIQGSILTGQLSPRRCGLTHPGRRCGVVFIRAVALESRKTSISSRERHRRGCAACPLTTLRK